MLNTKIKHIDWERFLCSRRAEDYVMPDEDYKKNIECAVRLIKNADHLLLGAGAGSSTAAGMDYGGKRFTDNFAEFIDRYGKENMTDMYSAGFYPYPSEEAKWGYWSKYVIINRFARQALPLYKELFDIVRDKDYFVLTTNVDAQFEKAGFSQDRIFATQGDYAYLQCARACHQKIYYSEKLFFEMDAAREHCLIPSRLVPKCPVCGGKMEMNLRADNYFVEDEAWHQAADRYAEFLSKVWGKRVVLLELGVGFNTPVIIRFPFERFAAENADFSLIRLNLNQSFIPSELGDRAIGIDGDMARAVADIREGLL